MGADDILRALWQRCPTRKKGGGARREEREQYGWPARRETDAHLWGRARWIVMVGRTGSRLGESGKANGFFSFLGTRRRMRRGN